MYSSNSKGSKEDGYHSSGNTFRTNASAEFSPFLMDGYYSNLHSTTRQDGAFSPNSFTSPRTPRAFSPIDNNLNKSSNFDGRGILIERIKIAQNTIDSLSSKVFCYENEREHLKEQKEAYEKGYYKLLQENSQILNDNITKNALLKKIDIMGNEVSLLLEAQQTLLEKHKDQQKNIEFYKTQNKLTEEENQSLRNMNDEIKSISSKNSSLIIELRTSEEELKNQVVVLKIEKEAQASELERLSSKLQKFDEKLRIQKERETSSTRDHSLLREKIRLREDDLINAEESIIFLQNQMKNFIEERDESQKDSENEIVAAYEDIKTLQESLTMCQKDVFLQKEKSNELEKSLLKTSMDFNKLTEQLSDAEKEKRNFVSNTHAIEEKLSEATEQCNLIERENKSLKQKLKIVEKENSSVEKHMKTNQEESNKSQRQSEEQIKDLLVNIEKIQNDFHDKQEESNKIHSLQVFELESSYYKSEELVTKLQNDLKFLNQKCHNMNDDYLQYKQEHSEQTLSLKNKETKFYQELQDLEMSNNQLAEKVTTLSQQLHKVQTENNVLHGDCQEKNTVTEKQTLTIDQLTTECIILKKINKENLELIDLLNKQTKSEMLSEKTLYETKLSSLHTDVENLTVALKTVHQEQKMSTETYKSQILSLQKENDAQLDNLSSERDDLNDDLQNAVLDLNEYKSKFNSIQNELEDVSSVNADLKKSLSLLSKELESYQQEMVQNLDKDDKITTLEHNIQNLNSRISELSIDNEEYKQEKESATHEASSMQERMNSLTLSIDNQENEFESERKELHEKETNLRKEHRDVRIRVEKLKTECRKRAMQSHAKCGELEVIKAEGISMKKELEIVTELNKKLEEVNGNLQYDNNNLNKSIEQLQADMHLLKTSYEDLLAKELTKQKSEFLVKENQLLKRLSCDSLPVISLTSVSPPVF